jgi:hypothetical protein
MSPARIELLKNAVDTQEKMLNGVELVFRGLSHHPDAEVSSVSEVVLGLLKQHHETIDAMVEGLTATKH